MSIAGLLPIRIGLMDWAARKPKRTRHRAVDEVARQKAMRSGADLLIMGLRLQLQDQEAKHAEVIARIDERHGETVRGLEQQIADLERRLNVGVLAEAAAAKTQEIDVRSLRERFETGDVRRLGAAPIAAVLDPAGVRAEGVTS